MVSTCRFRSVACHCWFPPAVSGLSEASHFFRRCDRRRRISHLQIPLFFLFYFSFFSFVIAVVSCHRCRLSNGNCFAHWRIGRYYCVESTVQSRSGATGGCLLWPSPSNAKGVVGLSRAPNTGMGAKNGTVYPAVPNRAPHPAVLNRAPHPAVLNRAPYLGLHTLLSCIGLHTLLS